MNTSQKNEKNKPRLFRSSEYKLKDKVGRNMVIIDFKEHIGFYPEALIIRKVPGKNNSIVFEFMVPPDFDIEKKKKEVKEKNKK